MGLSMASGGSTDMAISTALSDVIGHGCHLCSLLQLRPWTPLWFSTTAQAMDINMDSGTTQAMDTDAGLGDSLAHSYPNALRW